MLRKIIFRIVEEILALVGFIFILEVLYLASLRIWLLFYT